MTRQRKLLTPSLDYICVDTHHTACIRICSSKAEHGGSFFCVCTVELCRCQPQEQEVSAA